MGGSQGNEEALKTNLILDNLVKNVSYVQIGLVNTLNVFVLRIEIHSRI